MLSLTQISHDKMAKSLFFIFYFSVCHPWSVMIVMRTLVAIRHICFGRLPLVCSFKVELLGRKDENIFRTLSSCHGSNYTREPTPSSYMQIIEGLAFKLLFTMVQVKINDIVWT